MNQISEQTQNELNLRHKRTLIILFAQFWTIVILTIAAWFIIEPKQQSEPTQVSTILWIVLLVIAIGAFLLRRILFAPAVLRDTAVLQGASGLLKSLQTKTIILSALAELVAILGFVITFLNGDKYDMLRAAGVALIIFFISFPSKAAWQRVAAAASK